MIFDTLAPTLFGLAVVIQLVYLLFVFSRLLFHRDEDSDNNGPTPGVSVVVAACNELENLKALIPIVCEQDYPNFELIIVDDRSSDGSYDYLLGIHHTFPNVSFVRVKALPEHFTAKKYAVTMGIKKAGKEIILLTDADCRPNGKQWIRQMIAQLTTGKELVLGFSPYYFYPGTLNAFIRYETFQTALQYFSFAKAGIPFMGVGRNLMYEREKFWEINGFARHSALLSGDDDLLVNAIATKANTAVALHPESFVYSEPKHTFKAWTRQKRRHLSVGKQYKLRDRISLGLLWLSFIGLWILLPLSLFAEPAWFQLPTWLIVPNEWLAQFKLQHYEPFTNWMRTTLITFLTWLCLRWFVLHKCNRKLGSTVQSSKILVYDVLYFVYLIVFGVMTLFSNPKKIKWR